MPGVQGPGRQGLHTSNNRRGAELLVEATGKVPMSGVREGPSNGITGYPLQKPARCSKRGGGAEGQRGRRQ